MNEMRLISANELYRLIEEEFDGVCVYDVEPSEAIDHFQSIVDRATTVDAEPIRHGKWIPAYNGAGRLMGYDCPDCHRRVGKMYDTNYCPNCGCKMNGVE